MTARKTPLIPKGSSWVAQIFEKAIARDPDGLIFRRVSSVERHASEKLLIETADLRGFRVTRMGTHYLIHRPFLRPVPCPGST